MSETKEQIMLHALRLFARRGYNGVTVRDISSALGITQSALYKHYKNKRDIFDNIIKKMETDDFSRAQSFNVPEKAYNEMRSRYADTALDDISCFTVAQFEYWTCDEFAANFRRMLTLEQYSSDEMTALYQQYLCGGITEYLEKLFIPYENSDRTAAQLALRYFSPVFMLISLCDGGLPHLQAQKLLDDHIKKFMKDI